METPWKWLPAFAVLLAPAIALAGDLQITYQKRTEQAVRGKAVEGEVAKSAENASYTINITNNSSKDTEALDVKYIIFVERERVGQKKGTEQIEPIKGSAKAEPIKARQKTSVNTEPVTLHEAGLQGNYIYSGGGKLKAKDSVKGLWIKVYQGDKVVAEYANPSTLATKQKWEE